MENDLKGLSVLVTRPDPQGSELCALITAQHGQAIFLPTIDFALPQDEQALQTAIAQLGQQDWIIFISPHAVYESIPLIRRAWPEFPPTVKFAAVGAGTAQALHQAGYNVEAFPETEWSSEGFLQLEAFQQLQGQKIAIVKGEGGRDVLAEILTERGAQVLPVISYRRIIPQIDVRNVAKLLREQQIDVVFCASFAAIENLKILLSREWDALQTVPLLVISDRIKILAHDLGFQTIWLAPNAGHDAILYTLLALVNEKREKYD